MDFNIIDSIKSVFTPSAPEPNPSAVNGEIDCSFQQGKMGDCALLSSIFSLSQTEEGAQSIKDSISINTNKKGVAESYDVTFAGTNETYHITQKELQNAKVPDRNGRVYSSGDDDVTLLELALEKAYKESEDETLNYLVNNYSTINLVDKLNGVNPASVTYLLTGKLTNFMDVTPCVDNKVTPKFIPSSEYTVKDAKGNDYTFEKGTMYRVEAIEDDGKVLSMKNCKDQTITKLDYQSYLQDAFYKNVESDTKNASEIMSKFHENKDTQMIVFTVANGDNVARDPDNNDVQLSEFAHAYAVKDVKDSIVTLVNPQNTQETHDVTLNSLLDLKKYSLFTLDLSE